MVSQRNAFLAFLTCSLQLLVCAATSPVKVFILAGDSNMVGKGSKDDLLSLPAASRRNLWDGFASSERGDIYVKFRDEHGKLTVSESKYASKGKFGPEAGFGRMIGDAGLDYESPVLLLKVAWGSTSLAVDWRPPSSGKGNYGVPDEDMYGSKYDLMIKEITETLSELPNYVPGHNVYELAGFVWFQGWNDSLNEQAALEYQQNLMNLIDDVRDDLGVSDLPVVIGEMGRAQQSTGKTTHQKELVDTVGLAQIAAADELNMCSFVPTQEYISQSAANINYGPPHHFYGRAKTFLNIGEDLGTAMLGLLSAH